MNINKLLLGAVGMIVVMLGSTAHASTIQWTLENGTFSDGGTLSGTFGTDSATGNLLSYDLTSTAGSIFGGFNYNSSDSYIYGNNPFSPNSFLIANNSPLLEPYLNLEFQNGLTYIGTDSLVTGYQPLYVNSGSWECTTNCGPFRTVSSGYAISAVPEPETYGMWLAGLGLIVLMAYRRKNDFSNMLMTI